MKTKNVAIGTLFTGLLLLSSHGAIAETVSYGAIATSATALCSGSCRNLSINQQSGGDEFASVSSLVDDFKGLAQAEATLTGSSYLPILRASAFSITNSSAASSTATGLQSYSPFLSDQEIILDLSLTGSETGNADIEAQVAVFLTTHLDGFSRDFGTTAFEFAFVKQPDGTFVDTRIASTQLFGPSATQLGFTVPAGQSFLIWAGLQAFAQNEGSANAFNTFTMDLFDATDLNNLVKLDLRSAAAGVPDLSTVPLPAGAWLFLTGIVALIGVTRRHKLLART